MFTANRENRVMAQRVLYNPADQNQRPNLETPEEQELLLITYSGRDDEFRTNFDALKRDKVRLEKTVDAIIKYKKNHRQDLEKPNNLNDIRIRDRIQTIFNDTQVSDIIKKRTDEARNSPAAQTPDGKELEKDLNKGTGAVQRATAEQVDGLSTDVLISNLFGLEPNFFRNEITRETNFQSLIKVANSVLNNNG